MINTLSENAKKIYTALKQSGGMWESNAIDILHPKPEYGNTIESKNTYWQWEANKYGSPVERLGKVYTPSANYRDDFQRAWYEIKSKGLGYSKNNGFNEYSLFVK